MFRARRRWDRRTARGIERRLAEERLSRADLKTLLHKVPRENRAAVRQALSESLLRKARLDSRTSSIDQVFTVLVMACLVIVVTIAAAGSARVPSGRTVTPHDPFVAEIAGGMAPTMLLVVPLVLAIGWRHRRPGLEAPTPLRHRVLEVAAPITVASMTIAVCASAMTISADEQGWRYTLRVGALGVGFMLLLGALLLAEDTAVRALSSRIEQPRDLDTAVIGIARAVAAMTVLAPAWRRPDVSRFLLECLERAASAVGRRPTSNRIPIAQWRLRTRVQRPGDEVAAVIRAHKVPIATARSRADYDRVLASLVTGLVAAAHEDWDVLLAHADSVPPQRWYHTYPAKNLAPAVILAAAAVALPWLPPFHGNTASILGLRVTLGVYALLRLIPGTSLTDLVDRGLARGFSDAKGK